MYNSKVDGRKKIICGECICIYNVIVVPILSFILLPSGNVMKGILHFENFGNNEDEDTDGIIILFFRVNLSFFCQI